MHFNTHFNLVGKHAFLSASKYHWINYDDEKLDATFRTSQAAARGTALHQLAYDLIKLGVKLPRTSSTLNMYVNDAIGWKMTPEQVLFYSDNVFGTADTISFTPRKNLLRINDLKTGITPANMSQLMIYEALFCLEYGFKPHELEVELRIYQNDEFPEPYSPDPGDIVYIMDKIITFDRRIELLKTEV